MNLGAILPGAASEGNLEFVLAGLNPVADALWVGVHHVGK